ncbi:hypothetical protein CWO01_23840 [Vibrio splendidus]|nr:hypothetical protein CWO01_23840 [Vibrio splendidus]
MFESHNKYTKAICIILILSSVIGLISVGGLFTYLTLDQPPIILGMVILLLGMLLTSIYFSYAVYNKNLRVLKLCYLLYALQLVGFETDSYALSLTFGLKFFVNFNVGNIMLSINLMAIAIMFLVYKSLQRISIANKAFKRN